jgi:lysophospholipase L1-like esterase
VKEKPKGLDLAQWSPMRALTPLCSGLMAVALLTAACSKSSESPTSPTETPAGAAVHYTVLGASDGIGFGGSLVCAPFDLGCENGTGYAQTIRRRFQADGRTVTFTNLSVPGAVLSRPIADLAMSLGRSDPGNFVERYPPFVPTTTTHVTIFAGGNDANVIGSAVAAGRGGVDVRGYVDAQVRQWVTSSTRSVPH